MQALLKMCLGHWTVPSRLNVARGLVIQVAANKEPGFYPQAER